MKPSSSVMVLNLKVAKLCQHLTRRRATRVVATKGMETISLGHFLQNTCGDDETCKCHDDSTAMHDATQFNKSNPVVSPLPGLARGTGDDEKGPTLFTVMFAPPPS